LNELVRRVLFERVSNPANRAPDGKERERDSGGNRSTRERGSQREVEVRLLAAAMRDKSRRRTNRGTAVITYWVWAERSAELSPFVGFSRTAVEQAGVVESIAQLSSSVFELFAEKSRAGFARMPEAGFSHSGFDRPGRHVAARAPAACRCRESATIRREDGSGKRGGHFTIASQSGWTPAEQFH
jgi:hypothetical protein